MVSAKMAAEGKFLKVEHVQESENKIGVIISEGQYVDGKFGRKLEIGINFNAIMKTWSLNSKSANNLMEAYGEDTTGWIGKKVEFGTGVGQNGLPMILGKAVEEDIKEEPKAEKAKPAAEKKEAPKKEETEEEKVE